MNLLNTAWVPVIDRDGHLTKVRPRDIPGASFVRVQHPRKDISCLTTELLIDLFQTVCDPQSDDELLDYVDGVRLPDSAAFDALAPSFELASAGPRFLQGTPTSAEEHGVCSLLFDAPLENTIKKNNDIFATRNSIRSICPHCMPSVLYLNQSHARMGGNGYSPSRRTGSALAAIIEKNNLWQTITMNLLPAAFFDKQAGRIATDRAPASFPWMAPELLTKGPKNLFLRDVGRYGMLWWTPVNLRFSILENTAGLECGLCGQVHSLHAEKFVKSPVATKLSGDLRHPRTGWNATFKGKDEDGAAVVGMPLNVPPSILAEPALLAGLTLGAKAEDQLPAFQYWASHGPRKLRGARMHLSGWRCENTKAEGWLDSTAPLWAPDTPEQSGNVEAAVKVLLALVNKVGDALSRSLYFGKPSAKSKVPGPALLLQLRTSRESGLAVYYVQAVQLMTEVLAAVGDAPLHPDAAAQFKQHLTRVALHLFQQAVVLPTTDLRLMRLYVNRERSLQMDFDQLT